MSKRNRRILYGSAGAAVVVGGLYAFSSLNRASADFDPSRVAAVERGPMVRSVVATGKIEPIRRVEIKSKANGIIEKLNVEVGEVVNAGDIIAELDKENLLARLRESRANLQAAEASLKGAKAQLVKTEIEAEGPDVEFAQRASQRAVDLYAQKLIAQSALDDSRSILEVALNRQRSARSSLAVSRARVTEMEANVAQAAASVERAQEELANATIRAPIRATVLTRDVEVGSPVSSILNLGANATLVVTLGDIEEVFVRGRVDEADIGRVQLRQPARITVETFKDRKFDGTVTRIAPIGVEKENVTSFSVEVSIRNPGSELKANMTANAEIILEERPDSLIIPEAAVVYDAKRNPFVEVPAPGAEGGRRRVPVKLGIGNGTRTQVLEGLKAGDKVILQG